MIVTVTHQFTAPQFRAWCDAQGYPPAAQGATVQLETWIRLIIREAMTELTTPELPRLKARKRHA